MLDLFTIQIFQTNNSSILKEDFRLILDTQMVLNLPNRYDNIKEVIKVIKDIFDSENQNIYPGNETFYVYINTNYPRSNAHGGLKLLIEFNGDCEIEKVTREAISHVEIKNFN